MRNLIYILIVGLLIGCDGGGSDGDNSTSNNNANTSSNVSSNSGLWRGNFVEIHDAYWKAHECFRSGYGVSVSLGNIKIIFLPNVLNNGLGIMHPNGPLVGGWIEMKQGTAYIYMPEPDYNDSWEVRVTRDTLTHEIGHALEYWSKLGIFDLSHQSELNCMPRWQDTNFGMIGSYDPPIYRD